MPGANLKKFRHRITGRGLEIKSALVTGGATATNLACAGIKRGDQVFLALVLEGSATLSASGAAIAIITSEASITTDGQIQFSTTTTTNEKVLVQWVTPK